MKSPQYQDEGLFEHMMSPQYIYEGLLGAYEVPPIST